MVIKLGSHIRVSSTNKYLEGSIKEAISYGANAMMVYTGAPQNTIRTNLDKMHIPEYKKILKDNNIPNENVVIHAPYIINLGNLNPRVRELAVSFLKTEMYRSQEFGAKYLVLHPGNHLGVGVESGIENIVNGLNEIFSSDKTDIIILLETMAGKGTEIGKNFNELKLIIEKCRYPHRLAVCLDTCHINDAGYNLKLFDNILDEFDQVIGLDKLKVIHLNDSKNYLGAKKDRHENLGYGTIGFEVLNSIVHSTRTKGIIKILETPWVNGKPPYKDEIKLLKSSSWFDFKKNY